jgi:hydrogenase small subunit
MAKLNRRDFLKISGVLAGAAGLAAANIDVLARGLESIARGTTRVLWLEGMSCSGCSVSLLNSENPGPLELITKYVSLVLQPTIGAAQGHLVLDILDKAEEAGDCVVVFEGALPLGMPEASLLAGKPLGERALPLLKKAPFVVAAGTCASFGGIPAAEGNPTGAASVKKFMEANGVPWRGKLVNCPSCPTHPLSLVGTLAMLAAGQYPEVDPELLTPVKYYGTSTHDNCPRYHDYNKHIFAKNLGDQKGCLFELGCLGPLSFTKCPDRQWNGGVNWCVRASAPCIACSSPHFAARHNFPFYRENEENLAEPVDLATRRGDLS